MTPATIAYDQITQRLGAIGELQPISSNQLATVLAPGNYSLALQVAGHDRVQRDVIITARSRSYVAVVVR